MADQYGAEQSGTEQIKAEMVANVLKVLVTVGQEVAAGEAVVILESMKMEIPVLAEVAGEVVTIDVHEGDVVQEGDVMVEMQQRGQAKD